MRSASRQRVRTLLALVAAAGTLCASASAFSAEPLQVVVTIPVLKDWTEQIGAPHVQVVSLISGLQNEHSYSPKPSDLMAVRRAKMLVRVGLGLEVWVDALVKNAGNPALQVVTTSQDIAVLHDEPGDAEAAPAREAHGRTGNPHIWLDPSNAKIMLKHVTDALCQSDALHAEDYRRNFDAYVRRLDQLAGELTERVRRLPDRRFVAHHPAWPYFARHFGFEIAGHIVSQAGAEPSARHLRTLMTAMRRQRIRVVVSEPQLNRKIPEALAKETGARVVVLTALPGGLAGTETYLDLLRYNVLQLAETLETAS
jgi:ABC-type Zn uptake system ZnuABC Zn-binding protein ZnuA